MKNRFSNKKTFTNSRRTTFLSLFIFCAILGCFLLGVNSVSNTTFAKQQESLETALSRSIAQCYAVEGMYPPNLDYLKKHYGLSYDENIFLVDYQPIGSNIAPEVTVLPRASAPNH